MLWSAIAICWPSRSGKIQKSFTASSSMPCKATSSTTATSRRRPTKPRLAERLGIIADLGQAPELVAAVRREFARPNAYIDVSTPLIAAGAEPVNRMEHVTDNILGTRIHGDALTTGTVEVASIPSDDKAVLAIPLARARRHRKTSATTVRP